MIMNKTKKTYTKPDVMSVDFSLGSSMSSGCTYIGNFDSGDSCGYNDNGFIIFINSCQIVSDKDFCYHVPTADTNVFDS